MFKEPFKTQSAMEVESKLYSQLSLNIWAGFAEQISFKNSKFDKEFMNTLSSSNTAWWLASFDSWYFADYQTIKASNWRGICVYSKMPSEKCVCV